MAGRKTGGEVEVIQEVGEKGTATQFEVEVLQEIVSAGGRGSVMELEVLQVDDETFPVLSQQLEGWGFIPIGLTTIADVYTDTYEDEY